MLEARGLSHSFAVSAGMLKSKVALKAVSDVSFSIPRGETFALVGESGCGKSTLARLILGLLDPACGEVLVEGKPLRSYSRLERAALVQPIFQDPYSSLNPRKSIGQIINLPLVVHHDPDGATRRRRVEKMMDLVGLPSRLYDQYPNELSGGQRQRVAIARALINRPKIVVCDEPTSALDVSVQAQILNLLQDLRDEFGLTYVFISHNLAVVQHLAERVAIMYLGRLVEVQPTARLFSEPRHPYTQALLGSVLTPDPRKGVPDTQIRGSLPNPVDPPSGCPFHPRCREQMPVCTNVLPDATPQPGGYVRCHLYSEVTEARKLCAADRE